MAPTITPQNAERMRRPWRYAMIPNAANAMMSKPAARPSRPSVKLTEFEVARIMNMKRGMYHQPMVTSPIHGMLIESNPNFSKNQ